MDAYIRVSRRLGRAGPGYISPKVQRDAIQRWADYRNVEIIAWHVDEDQSGGTQARPGLREAMRRIEAHETDGLACWRLNRFARNVSDAIRDVERIHAAGAQLACIEEDIDPTGPFGRFILTILLAVATLERDNVVTGFLEAKRRAVERGAYISRTPFGYKRSSDGTLEPHPRDAPIVSEAFRLAASDSVHAAHKYLEQAVPRRRWTMTTTRRLLSGRSYLGETRNGQLLKLDTHQPLVARSVWEAAQSSPASRSPSASFPLSSLAICATCGQALIGGRGGKGQRTYRCSGTLSGRQNCKRGAAITASILEDYIREQARQLLGDLRAIISDPDTDTLTLLERAVSDAEAELDAFAADLRLRSALGDRYHAHLETRIEALRKAQTVYREQARDAHARLELDSPAVLEDPEMFGVVLRSIFSTIIVTPGRGMSVADRVRLVPVDVDSATGVSGAEDAE